MNKIAFLTILFLSSFSFSQDEDITKAFDFWVGHWDAKWMDANGNEIHGENKISKTSNDGVIFEEFSDSTNQFYGNSLSVYSPVDSTWHQAWADNSGGYIEMVGIVQDDHRIFQTKEVQSGDSTIVRRMVFYNIQEDSFTWDWEISFDGGQNWNLSWRILYTRKD